MSRIATTEIKRFGEKLRSLRLHHGMTLTELTVALGYKAHGHISELESGKKLPTIGFVLGVAKFFSVTTDELLKDELELSICRVEKEQE